MSSYATTGTTTAAPAATHRVFFGRNKGGNTGTTGRKRSSGPGALAKNEMMGKPATKFSEMRAKSGERWGLARAVVQEKFSKMGASISYGTFAITHPIHPIRVRAAKDAEVQKKKLAEDRRRQQEGLVRSNAAAKVAQAREARIATLNTAVRN